MSDISRDGKVLLKFNQPLIPPSFAAPTERVNGRFLLSLEELDVARDVADVKIVSNNGVDNDKLAFYLSIEEWTADHLMIFVNFTNPQAVSDGAQLDSIVIDIKNPSLFISETGQALSQDRATIIYPVQ